MYLLQDFEVKGEEGKGEIGIEVHTVKKETGIKSAIIGDLLKPNDKLHCFIHSLITGSEQPEMVTPSKIPPN